MTGSFTLSALDEERFGVRSARGEVESIGDLDLVEKRCDEERVEFLVVRAPTVALEVVQEMERRGHFLTDTLVYMDRDLVNAEVPALGGRIGVRPIRNGEADSVRDVAAAAFTGYFGHYHADPHFTKEDCDEIYSDWAYRGSTDRGVADQVLVAEIEGSIKGFCLIKIQDGDVAVGTLYGVHPDARGRGAYRELVISAMMWARANGCVRMLESTQVTNRVSQKVWARLGFVPSASYYTLHRWFAREAV
jgi:GNAT superfamily N-acetyltransferase